MTDVDVMHAVPVHQQKQDFDACPQRSDAAPGEAQPAGDGGGGLGVEPFFGREQRRLVEDLRRAAAGNYDCEVGGRPAGGDQPLGVALGASPHHRQRPRRSWELRGLLHR